MQAAIRRIHSKYLGEKTFPKEITEFDIREFFTLSAEDLRAIRVDSNKKSRLALALQVGFLRMTGAVLDTYDYIPRAVLECVAKQLHVAAPMLATMRALSRRYMTRDRHQSWACRYLGISRLKAADDRALFSALTAEMAVTVDREQMITRALEIFWNHRWRIPTRRAVEQKVREAKRRVETQVNGASALEWIRRPPGKRGAKSRTLAIAKLEYLRTAFRSITMCKILISPERLRAYARRLQRRRVDPVKEIAEPDRTLEVVGFIHTMLERQADRVLRMLVMAIARIWRNAQERAASRVRDGITNVLLFPTHPPDCASSGSIFHTTAEATIHRQIDSRDPGRPWRRKESDCMCDFLRCAKAAGRLAREIRCIVVRQFAIEIIPRSPLQVNGTRTYAIGGCLRKRANSSAFLWITLRSVS